MQEQTKFTHPDEPVQYEFDNGWRIVQLKNQAAIVLETKVLKHKVDSSSDLLERNYYMRRGMVFYSLRDVDDHPLATMRCDRKTIQKCKAAGDRHPSAEMMQRWIEFAQKRHLTVSYSGEHEGPYSHNAATGITGFVKKGGRLFDICNLPENFEYPGTISYVNTDERGPDDIGKPLGCNPNLPRGLVLGGDLDLYGAKIKQLPAGLNVRDLNVSRTGIVAIPADAIIRRSLVAFNTPLKTQLSDQEDRSLLHSKKPRIAKKIIEDGPQRRGRARE